MYRLIVPPGNSVVVNTGRSLILIFSVVYCTDCVPCQGTLVLLTVVPTVVVCCALLCKRGSEVCVCVCRQVCGTRTVPVHVPVLRSVHRVRYTDVEGTETRTTGTNTKYQYRVPGY